MHPARCHSRRSLRQLCTPHAPVRISDVEQVWLPQIVTFLMQSAIFWLAFYYRGCRGECTRTDEVPASAGSADERFLSSTTVRCDDDAEH